MQSSTAIDAAVNFIFFLEIVAVVLVRRYLLDSADCLKRLVVLQLNTLGFWIQDMILGEWCS